MTRLFLVGLCWLFISAHARPQEPLVAKVKNSIDRGIKYLRETQRPDGSWETNLTSVDYRGGGTALAVLALLNSGVPANHPDVQRGLKSLRTLDTHKTYVKALQTMAFAEAGFPEDLARIKQAVQWFQDTAIYKDGGLIGWSYGHAAGNPDNSNTQYALLGMWAGRQAGVRVPASFWTSVRTFFEKTQNQDGGWSYSVRGLFSSGASLLTMTEAGVCGLYMAQMELDLNREQFKADGSASNCGKYPDNQALTKGLNWISGPNINDRDRLQFDLHGRTFYNIYGIERVGRLSGNRFLGRHDWYREGCDFLVRLQRDDGSWWINDGTDSWTTISTSFALLFLSKGRTPLLVSKLVHTLNYPRPENDTDWNNDRNDMRHLTEFVGKNLFKMPLAWQTLDLMRAVNLRGAGNLTDDQMEQVVSDMLQAPILYFNGHNSPALRFRQIEKDLLKLYIENGGFIFVEACCNSPQFDQGFKRLADALWPDSPLEPLDPRHPVWTIHYPVTPGDPYKLMGINLGCKTVLIYSPQDMSCQWEGDLRATPRGDRAFKLGTNIVAYATGLEPPKPRLTQSEAVVVKDDGPAEIPRGFLKVGQLKHTGDWQPAPKAMRNLMDHLRRFAGIDVSLKTAEVQIGGEKVKDYKFVYMHGRADFQFAKEQLKNLRFNLETGGLLFADACCGKEAFDKAFRKFAKDLFPEQKLAVVPPDDDLYGSELNGTTLTSRNIRCQREANQGYQPMQPYLEGIQLNGRWVLLYSKYDLGCALEKHKSADCRGYDYDSAARLAGAAVLYTLKP